MAKRSSKKSLKLTQAVARQQSRTEEVTFKMLYAESYKYIIRPKYQRDLTWNLREKQQFIDSLFSGDPFPPVEGYEGFFTEGVHIGEPKWEIGDGQNRLYTILEFMADAFKTMTEAQKLRYEPFSQVGPVQPGKLFSELDQITKNWFNSYKIRIDVLRERAESEKGTRFLRVENHRSLSAAEKLKVISSKARDAATLIEKHPFWEDFYEGKRSRGQVFQSSLYLLALEMTPGGIADLQSGGFIQSLIFGNYDDKITEGLIKSVLARLDVVSHLYSELHFTRRIFVVAMYQSALFSQKGGYVLQEIDRGTLTKWAEPILDETKRSSGIPSYAKPIQALASAHGQRAFWAKHENTVKSLLKIKDSA